MLLSHRKESREGTGRDGGEPVGTAGWPGDQMDRRVIHPYPSLEMDLEGTGTSEIEQNEILQIISPMVGTWTQK